MGQKNRADFQRDSLGPDSRKEVIDMKYDTLAEENNTFVACAEEPSADELHLSRLPTTHLSVHKNCIFRPLLLHLMHSAKVIGLRSAPVSTTWLPSSEEQSEHQAAGIKRQRSSDD
jgi:hypothetical protein